MLYDPFVLTTGRDPERRDLGSTAEGDVTYKCLGTPFGSQTELAKTVPK